MAKNHVIMKRCCLVGLMAAMLCLVPKAMATTIDLSTGTAAYSITSDTNTASPDSGYTGPAIVVTPTLAAGWLANPITDGAGQSGVWVAPTAIQGGISSTTEHGTTVYQVTFDLTGLNPATAVLTMNLTADDWVSVTLNGTSIFNPTPSNAWTSAYGTFTVGSGFNSTTNTLVFTVDNFSGDGSTNTGGPTGLDVAANVTASPLSTVPEPGTLALLGTGLMAVAARIRKRSKGQTRS